MTATVAPTPVALAAARRYGANTVDELQDLCGPIDVAYWRNVVDQREPGADAVQRAFLAGMTDRLNTIAEEVTK